MWGRKLNGEGGGRQHRRIQHQDRQGDGNQEQHNQQGGEEIGDDEDQEQSAHSRNNDGGNQVMELQGQVLGVSCMEDTHEHKLRVMKQEREDYSRRTARKRIRPRAWRIKPYTAIVELGSATGQTSSFTKLLLKGTETSSQEYKELSPTSRDYYAVGLKSQGRGPWKPAWPPPRDRLLMSLVIL